MPRSKTDCPDCCTYTVTITPENCGFVWEEQTKLKKKNRKNMSVERTLNKIITEHAFLTGKTTDK